MVWAEKGQMLAICICVHAVAGAGKIRHNQVINTVSLICFLVRSINVFINHL